MNDDIHHDRIELRFVKTVYTCLSGKIAEDDTGGYYLDLAVVYADHIEFRVTHKGDTQFMRERLYIYDIPGRTSAYETTDNRMSTPVDANSPIGQAIRTLATVLLKGGHHGDV